MTPESSVAVEPVQPQVWRFYIGFFAKAAICEGPLTQAEKGPRLTKLAPWERTITA